MNNNDVIRGIQQILKLNEAKILDIFKLANYKIEVSTISNLLREEGNTDYLQCDDRLMTLLLDGLITSRRGKSDKTSSEVPATFPPLTNNIIVKKLRIAFDLKEDDLIELLSLADYDVSKSELSSIFRKPGHKHYRVCSDDLLMALLTGLTFRSCT